MKQRNERHTYIRYWYASSQNNFVWCWWCSRHLRVRKLCARCYSSQFEKNAAEWSGWWMNVMVPRRLKNLIVVYYILFLTYWQMMKAESITISLKLNDNHHNWSSLMKICRETKERETWYKDECRWKIKEQLLLSGMWTAVYLLS